MVVQNDNWSDVTVYIYHEGTRFRLGLAAGASKSVFTIQPWKLQPGRTIQILARPMASERYYLSDVVVVNRDEYLDLSLGQNIEASFLTPFLLRRQ